MSYSPTFWGYTMSKPERAYFAQCPTLRKFDELYGDGSASDWIYIQVVALYGASSNKDKELAKSISIFSEAFAAETKQYKLSELMLFFGRYKAGRYDNSFQTFDTKRIGNAFFHEFLPQRSKEIGMFSQWKEEEESLKRRELPEGYVIPEGFNSLTWYQERKRRGEI
nr:hypothetical protein [uncultured Bacteroides sp.]